MNAPDERSSQQREAVFLKFYGEFTYHEIASLMIIDPERAHRLVASAVEISTDIKQTANLKL
jgi:DNA-directed RNA polymerase specialized sigma24 family protein